MSSSKSVLKYINIGKTEENYDEAKKTIELSKGKGKGKGKGKAILLHTS
jgi:hypothetical protein